MTSKHTIDTTDENFSNDVLKAELPVLVDFWAPWCGPCKAITPILEEIASEYANTLKIVKVNVDDCGNTAGSFGIRSIPTLKLFKDGEEIDSKIGGLPKSQLIALLNQHGIEK